MHHFRAWIAWVVSLTCVAAQTSPIFELAELQVASPRVANQEAVGTFAMPVTVLRYEPGVDLQPRNSAEAQSDIAIRGGTFENTGVKAGALNLYDPQTGHYLAEIPVAPEMLGSPRVFTGGAQATAGWNATAGSVAYRWLPVSSGGSVRITAGENGLRTAGIHAGAHGPMVAGLRVAADIAVADSRSDGAIPLGDHDFTRYNARIQLTDASSQTDFIAGYQSKFFGWPNLYTPFNAPESENLQTTLLALHHHARVGADDGYFQAGAYYRRNKDDYDFNRFTEAGRDPSFAHTTWVYGASLDGRAPLAPGFALGYRAGIVSDSLESTALTFGRFSRRNHWTAGVYPEWSRPAAGGGRWLLTAGLSYDDTNRDDPELSPMLELARSFDRSALQRVHVGYAKTTQVPTYTALNSASGAGLFRGNPDLERSVSHNVETGVRGTLGGWEVEAAVFFRRDEQLVDWTFAHGVTARTANAVDIDTAGVELLARRGWGPVDLMMGYAWLEKDADYGSALVDASFYALNHPRHRITAAIVARLGGGFELRVDNDFRFQADNPLRTEGGSEAVLSSASLLWRASRIEGLIISAQVDNLWDSDFQAVPAVPASPRQLSLSLGYRW